MSKFLNNNRKLNGYFTVEACLLFPLIFYVIVLIIYLSILVYDNTVSFQTSYVAAKIATSSYFSDNQEIYEKAVVNLENQDKKIATNSYQEEIKVSIKDISIQCDGNVNMPFSGIEVLGKKEEWHFETQAKSSRHDPIFYIRQIRKVKEID